MPRWKLYMFFIDENVLKVWQWCEPFFATSAITALSEGHMKLEYMTLEHMKFEYMTLWYMIVEHSDHIFEKCFMW